MNPLATVAAIGGFLLEHAELIEELFKAVTGGASKEALLAAIRRAAVDASDEQMRLELGAAKGG